MSTSTIKSQAQIEQEFYSKLIEHENNCFIANFKGYTIHIDRANKDAVNSIKIYGNSREGLIHSRIAAKSRKVSWLIACDYVLEEILNENTSYYIDSHYLPD